MAAPVFVTGNVPTAAQVNDWFVNILFARRIASQTLNTQTTPQDDNTLFVTVAANAVYAVQALFRIASQTAEDWKHNFVGPAGAVFDYAVSGHDTGAGGFTGDTIHSVTMPGTSALGGLGGTTSIGIVTGVLVVGGTGGTFKLQWSQNTSGASGTSLLTNSWLLLQRVA